MKFFTADLSEILLAECYDEEQIDYLTAELSQIVKDLFGLQIWATYWNHYRIVATTLYYTATTLSAVQTVGEEYVALLPLASVAHRKVPSFPRRVVFIFCYALVPFLTEKIFKRIGRNLENSLSRNETRSNRKQQNLYKTLLGCVIWIRFTGIPTLYRLNLALFYLFGTYYNISKRLLGFQYVSFRPQSNWQALPLFRFFGAVTIAQIVLNAVIWIRNELKRSQSRKAVQGFRQSFETEISEEEDDQFASETFRCSLCLRYSKSPACTPCGHLFCWNCILKHVQFTAAGNGLSFCPQCRHEFHQSRVVPLLNL